MIGYIHVRLYGGVLDNELHTANITAIVNRLQPLVRRAVDDSRQPLTSLGDDADIDLGAGSKAFQTLKNILSEEFADAATAEIEIGTKEIIVTSIDSVSTVQRFFLFCVLRLAYLFSDVL